MKKISITLIFLFSQIVYSQSSGVGINTTTPKSTFDINGKKDYSGLAVSTDIAGLQAPRLTRAELTSKGDTLYDTDQKGAIVYITDVSGGNVTGPRSNISSVGYYYFDGSAWQKMGMSSSVEQNIGSITAFSYSAIPSSYLVCDGSAVSRTTYSALFAKIGTTYGSGDGSTTFNLPDLRGEFIRGLDLGRGVDTGRALGTSQTDDFKSHNHSLSSNQLSVSTGTANDNLNNVSTGANRYGLIQTVTIGNTGGTETRPRNIAMVYAIKAKESAVISSSESQTIQNLITASEPWYSTTTGTGATTVTENIYHSGNVGIGTTSPTTKLHLESSTSGAFRYADGTQGANKVLVSDANGNASWSSTSPTSFADNWTSYTGTLVNPYTGSIGGSGFSTGLSLTIPSKGWYFIRMGIAINSTCNDYSFYIIGVGDVWKAYCGATDGFLVPRDQTRVLYFSAPGTYNVLAKKTNGTVPSEFNIGNPNFYLDFVKFQN
ncbi:phage tail protein [Chryseobacterium sp. SG20098]|uniref:phage tail protein n=1 Tax=Chryseobacterium sp. SG20098 TaxID=3074145 RepID=UPI0028835206|nr:phage tail protein [Chryseobacterium sp. SG20098]WNI36448.1 phage tail protein [Chryseobacterium sp. SG20098]